MGSREGLERGHHCRGPWAGETTVFLHPYCLKEQLMVFRVSLLQFWAPA